MPKKVWTPEERKAFADRMAAGRLAKEEEAASSSTDAEIDTASVAPPSAETQQDPEIAAKLKELDEAIARTHELNAQLEKGEQERTVKFNAGVKSITPEENQQVLEVHKSKAQRMKEHLESQEKVPVFIPLEGKEKMGTFLPVTLNGYRLNVPKGVYVQVPKQVQEEIMNSLNQTQQALDHKLNIDNADEKRQAALS